MTGSQVRILFAAPVPWKKTGSNFAGARGSPLAPGEEEIFAAPALRDLPHITVSPIRLVSLQRQATTANHRRPSMRKFILITALVLVSATAQAGGSRSLAIASNDEPAAAAQPTAVEAPKSTEAPKAADAPATTEAPKFVERPPAVDTTTDAPKTDAAKPEKKAEKPKHKRGLTEARVIYELHRHGIYW
jgi:hypothetical protein